MKLTQASHRREIRARASLEKRALTDAEKAAGYIGAIRGEIPYNSDSEVLVRRSRPRPFVERIAPEAFKRSITEDKDIILNAGHTDDPLAALARIGKNLTVTSDARALSYEGLVPDTRAGHDLLNLIDKGIITGTSFEFEIRDGAAGDKWEKRDERTDQRTILDARLLALNPVTWPAYSDTSLTVEMRRRDRDTDEERGTYLKPELGGCCDYYDPTLTPDTKFAGNALSRATYALTDALEYLRAAPAGAMADYAKSEVAAAAANAKTLIDWLAANGATVNPALEQRAKDALKQADGTAPAPTISPTTADHDRERRFRILQLDSR